MRLSEATKASIHGRVIDLGQIMPSIHLLGNGGGTTRCDVNQFFGTHYGTQAMILFSMSFLRKGTAVFARFRIDAAIAAVTSPSTPRANARRAGRHRVAEAPACAASASVPMPMMMIVPAVVIAAVRHDDAAASATRPHRQSATESFSSRSPAGFDMEPSIASAPNTGCKDSFPRRPLRNGALFRSE